MKILKTVYLSLSMALAIIAAHRISVEGFPKNYWIMMLSVLFFFLYMLRYSKDKLAEQNTPKKPKK
jgi:hypothetical protein